MQGLRIITVGDRKVMNGSEEDGWLQCRAR